MNEYEIVKQSNSFHYVHLEGYWVYEDGTLLAVLPTKKAAKQFVEDRKADINGLSS
jgi:hypothetical protein